MYLPGSRESPVRVVFLSAGPAGFLRPEFGLTCLYSSLAWHGAGSRRGRRVIGFSVELDLRKCFGVWCSQVSEGTDGSQLAGLPAEGMRLPRSSLLGALRCLFAPQLTGRKPVARSRVWLAVGTAADRQASGIAGIAGELKKITKSSGKVFRLV